MIDPKLFIDMLHQSDVRFFTGVPDSLLRHVSAYISDQIDSKQHIIAANEGNALALACGYYLASKHIPCVYLQNSGLGNLINPLLSLAHPSIYGIPMLCLIGWRGEPGVSDEPQHIQQGQITPQLLETMGIDYAIIDPTMEPKQVQKEAQQVLQRIKNTSSPGALVIKKGTFTSWNNATKNTAISPTLPNRTEVFTTLMPHIERDAYVFATTGFIARQLYEYRIASKQSHNNDFLTIGGMGHASAIAMGFALHQSEKKVYCLDGDGALLMHMGSMAIHGTQKRSNFYHILLNNGMHESVGGQPTVGQQIDFCAIAAACGYGYTTQITDLDNIEHQLHAAHHDDGCSFIHIPMVQTHNANLARPKHSPSYYKKYFMETLHQENKLEL